MLCFAQRGSNDPAVKVPHTHTPTVSAFLVGWWKSKDGRKEDHIAQTHTEKHPKREGNKNY
jgi:hypothetical protein